ncbi:MAG: fasciclin domain-containing protein [Leptolyngbyaceae bacterium]|nr:fasciclin domain-containing protein [Leptolyngbyaceae bacterium]
MRTFKNQSLNKKVLALLGATSASVLIGLPASAQFAKAETIENPASDVAPTSVTPVPADMPGSVEAVDALEAGVPVDAPDAEPSVDDVDAETPVSELEEPMPSSDDELSQTEQPTPAIEEQPMAEEEPVTGEEPPVVGEPMPSVEETPEASVESKKDSLAAVAATNESLSTFALALEAAGLTETFAQQGPMTVFAPSNEAFAALPAGLLDQLLSDPETLTRILAFHVVSGDIMSNQIQSGAIPTAEGSTVDVQAEEAGITVNGASVVEADLEAENGVVHIIDEVILPPDL